MSTTNLTVLSATYSLTQQHRTYDLRLSLADVGDVEDGGGDWHVYRDGDILEDESVYNSLDFAWIGNEGDVVTCSYYDSEGNRGEWVSDVFSDFEEPTYQVYVDSNAGNDTFAGTFEAPVASRAEARSRTLAALTTAGDIAVIHYKRNGEWTFTPSEPIWNGSDKSFRHHVRVCAYGSGNRPVFTAVGGAAVAFRVGNQGTVHTVGLEVNGVVPDTTTGSVIINAQRNGPEAKAALNILIDDCLFYNCDTGVFIEDNTISSDADLLDGRCNNVAIRNTVIRDVGNWHMYESSGLINVYRNGVTFLRQNIVSALNGPNTDRVSCWQNSFVRRMVWDNRGSNGLNGGPRWQAGPGRTEVSPGVYEDFGSSIWARGTYVDCTYYASDQSVAAWRIGRKAPDGVGDGLVSKVRFINCRTNGAKLAIGSDTNNGGNDIQQVSILNCTVGGTIDIGHTNGGMTSSVLIKYCATSQAGLTATPHIRLIGLPANYESGSVKIIGHVGVQPSTAGNQPLIGGGRCNDAQVASIISSESNYNHTSRYGDATVPWFVAGGVFGTGVDFYWLTLDQWKTLRGDSGDSASTARGNSTLGITDPGTSANNLEDFNPDYSSGSGVLDGLGGSTTYALDRLNYIRSSTATDPGPRQFGLTIKPDLPDASSTLISIAISSNSVSIGVGSSEQLTATGTYSDTSEVDITDLVAWSSSNNSVLVASNVTGSNGYVTGIIPGSAVVTARLGDVVQTISFTINASTGSINHPIRLKNLSTLNRFVGWHPVKTDYSVSNAFGLTADIPWVRGDVTGKDTRSVDMLIDLPPNSSLTIPNFVANPGSTEPISVTPIVGFFGGDPVIGGTPMTLVKPATTNGRAFVAHYRARVNGRNVQGDVIGNIFVVDLWIRWYANEPWARSEGKVTHSDRTSPHVTAVWPNHILSWGTGTLTVLGRAGSSGSIIDNGTLFGDGQARAFPLLWKFTNRIRSAVDLESILALEEWAITGHGIKTVHPDGVAYVRTDVLTWGAANWSGAISRLHNWTQSPNGIVANSKVTGPQADQTFVRYEPLTEVGATRTILAEAYRWAARPHHHCQPNGNPVNATSNPGLRIFEGRPFFTGSDNLGKPFGSITDGNAELTSNGWYGPDLEHDFINGLLMAVRFNVTDCGQHMLEHHAEMYLISKFPDLPTWGSNAAVQSSRDLIWEPIKVIGLDTHLANRTLAAAVVSRFITRCSPGGAIYSFLANAPYGDIWDVRTSPSASIPIVPGWMPWQQGPACWSLDYGVRTYAPAINALSPFILAGANRVLDTSYILEEVNGVMRWVEYERASISGVISRSNGFDLEWFPPLINYILRYRPNDPKARAIWTQILNDSLNAGADKRRWIPPNTISFSSGTFTGNSSITLPRFSISSQAKHVKTGTSAITLLKPSVIASSSRAHVFLGTSAIQIPKVSTQISGIITDLNVGSSRVILPLIQTGAQASFVRSGSLSIDLPIPRFIGETGYIKFGGLNVTLPVPSMRFQNTSLRFSEVKLQVNKVQTRIELS